MPSSVQFHVKDIVHPHPMHVLRELHEQVPLTGEVINVTDDGRECASFVTVRVRGLSEPVIVPAAKVSLTSPL